jgi:pimeloyl-ACP methyl ester carboxylesterase
MFFLASRGYRSIAHDRRGHGRSSQPWTGNDMDTYADDLAELVQKLDLKNAIHVGHSTGGGEVARYIARHGTKRMAKAVLISSVPPLMLKTPSRHGTLSECVCWRRAELPEDHLPAPVGAERIRAALYRRAERCSIDVCHTRFLGGKAVSPNRRGTARAPIERRKRTDHGV